MKRFLPVLLVVLFAVLMVAGCTPTKTEDKGDKEIQESKKDSVDKNDSFEKDLLAAVKSLYPGYEMVGLLMNEDGVQWVELESINVPGFIIKAGFIEGDEWERSTSVDGVQWSTSNSLTEVTEDAQLLTGDLQKSTMESVVADLGPFGAESQSWVVATGIVSNVEQSFTIEHITGDTETYYYKLDMKQTPHKFILKND